MRTFEYVAVDASGAARASTAQAASARELDRALEARGLTLTRVRERRRGRAARGGRLARGEVTMLCAQLATLTGAGVPLVEGLAGLAERADDERAKRVLERLVAALGRGESLASAMAAEGRAFPPVVLAAVRAGEASGTLPRVLRRVAKHLEWARAMRATTLQALVYPACLALAVGVLVTVLVTYVLPRILALFPAGLADLPRETRALLAVSTFVQERWIVLAALVAATAVGVRVLARRPAGRERLHALLLRLPGAGTVLARIATARFAATASILQAVGVDAFTMLEMAASATGNEALRTALGRATARVRAGEPIASALGREPLVDPLVVQMVAVGERTGELDATLEGLAAHYDEEVPRTVKSFLAVFEPALLLAAGVVVAFVLLAALLPVFELYGAIG